MRERRRAARPTVFVGSAAETIDVARGIQQNLASDARVIVWDQDVFRLSLTGIESLVEKAEASDFGVFVFTPDDVTHLRQKKYSAVRDNVVFEFGLFLGRLGRHRTFAVTPRRSRGRHRIPTDLAGVTLGQYDADDDDLVVALGPFCNAVRSQLRRLGSITRGGRKSIPPTSSAAQHVDIVSNFEEQLVPHLKRLDTVDEALATLSRLLTMTLQHLHSCFANEMKREVLLHANADSRDAQHFDFPGTVKAVAEQYARTLASRHGVLNEWLAWHAANDIISTKP